MRYYYYFFIMDRSTLKIFIRAKGLLKESSIVLSKDLHEIIVNDPAGKDPAMKFEYFQVFVETPQEEVFETCSKPVVEHVLDGFDGLIISYGPTHTGKSYSIFGKEYEEGIYTRSIQTFLINTLLQNTEK